MLRQEELETSPITDTLYRLEGNSLFWFLKKDQFDQIQHALTSQTVSLKESDGQRIMSIFAETLASDPDKKLNEDSFLVLPMGEGRMLVAVLDGVTSQKEISALADCGVKGGFYISHLVAFGFKDSPEYKELVKRETLTAGDIMRTVNSWIFQKMQDVGGVDYNDALSVPGLAATFALFDFNSNQITIAHVADTVGAVISSEGEVELITYDQNDKYDQETMNLLKALCEKHKCTSAQVRRIPEAEAKIKAHLRDSFRKKINTPQGCGILNGMSQLIENDLIYEAKVDITKELRSVFLFSDGALLPYRDGDRKAEDALALVVKSLYNRDEGKSSFLSEGRQILNEDIEWEQVPRLKAADDATVIKISL